METPRGPLYPCEDTVQSRPVTTASTSFTDADTPSGRRRKSRKTPNHQPRAANAVPTDRVIEKSGRPRSAEKLL